MSPNSSGEVQPALGAHRIGVFLALGNRRAAHLSGRIHGVLRLKRIDNLRDGDAELGQLIRLHPQAHGVLAGAEYLHVADAGDARQLIVQIDVGVVGQKLRVVGAVRRIEADHHQRRGD